MVPCADHGPFRYMYPSAEYQEPGAQITVIPSETAWLPLIKLVELPLGD